jgi:Flp pilus assembly protein TadG
MRIKRLSHHRPGEPTPPEPRRGIVANELLLVLPVLLLIVLGMAEFSLILLARQELLTASREGARVASHGGADRDRVTQEVKATVKRVLGDGRLGDAGVEVHFLDGDPSLPQPTRDRVEVVVGVGVTHVTPNFLGFLGLNLAGRRLIAGTVLNVE